MPRKIDPLLGLPEKFTEWRDDQYNTIEAIKKCDKPFFLADLPTGVGKTLISVGAHKVMEGRAVCLTGTKQLQDQILADFPDIAVTLKGKANYPCKAREGEGIDVTADDCVIADPSKCDFYHYCEYYVNRSRAKQSPFVVLNNAYYLNETNGFQSSFSGRELLIADEFDILDSALMAYIEIRINSRQLQRFGIAPPRNDDAKESWIKWAPVAIPELRERARRIRSDLDHQNFHNWNKDDLKSHRLQKSMDRLADRLEEIRAGLNDAWIFYSSQNKDQMERVFKPINVGPYAKKYLWSHSLFAIGMSGTILSPDIMCQELGIDNCDYIQLPSPFPVENRPIYYKPVVNLNHRTQTDQLPLLRDAIEHDLRLYPHGKVLIHTISYQIRNYLMQTLSCGDRLVTHESDDRQDALENFKITDKPLVMLSPSFDRGVDLRVEANCEAVMVCKMPFLSLGDPQVKAKVETPGGWSWYSLKAAQTLMQSTGRHIRSNTQRGDTWIYDSQFLKLLGRTKNIIPQWWQKALRYRDPITDEIRDF